MHITTNTSVGHEEKRFDNQKRNGRREIQPWESKFDFRNVYGLHKGKNDVFKPLICGSLLLSTMQHQKRITQPSKMRKLQKNGMENSPGISSCVRERNTWVNNGMGMHFWVFTCLISKNTIFQNDGLPQYEFDCHTL